MLKERHMRIFVGNLSFNTSEGELETEFTAFGTVATVTILQDRETGRARGFGFVEMADPDEAKAAIQGLNGKEVGGRALTVNEARPRQESGSRGGDFGNRGPSRRW